MPLPLRKTLRHALIAASSLALVACGMNGTDSIDENAEQTAQASSADNLADTMASNDYGDRADANLDIADSEERPVMQAQVILDRLGFGPGVIDGKMGISTENALEGFQEANELKVNGELDEATKTALMNGKQFAATRVVRIPDDWGAEKYTEIPDDTAEKAKLERLGYTSLDERLAERFHTTLETLELLNPGGKPAGMKEGASAEATGTVTPQGMAARPDASPKPSPSASATGAEEKATTQSVFKPGQLVRVPNIGGDRIAPGNVEDENWQQTLAALGVGSDQPAVDRIVVSKAGKTLRAYAGDKLISLFTVSSGSSEFPLPLGDWKIVGEAYNPTYNYDPEVLSGGKGETFTLPPGPNGPVGVVWIDLSKDHYGIHGTPEPSSIGRAQSHGCVRLTNWDAARLAQMVSTSTKVEFVA